MLFQPIFGPACWVVTEILRSPCVCSPLPCLQTAGPSQALGALTASCGDAVLAVRLQTAAALAAFCGMLAAAAAPAAAAEALPGCLRLAVGAAAAGNEKVRPSGLQALGSLLDMCGRLPSEVPAAGDAAQLLAAAAAAVQDSLGSGNAARVQWAACEAAGQLLACSAAATQQHVAATVRQLLALLRECPNFRSRALAAAALRRLPSLAPAADASGGPEGLLDAVAAVLFQGGWYCIPD